MVLVTVGALALMLLLLAVGVPVFAAIGLGAAIFLQTSAGMNPQIITDGLFSSLDTFALVAVPLYIFTGDVVAEAGLADKLLNFAEALVGGFRSGLGSSTLLGCGFFATISGSSSADAAAIGRITVPRLEDVGYTRSYASALVASGASTGVLIPPSITYIIAGIVLGLPASTLFTVAFIPGVLIIVSMLVVNVIVNRRADYEQATGALSLTEIATAAWDSKWGLSIPVIILGGIYAGVFTPTEAAAVAVFVTLVVGGFKRTIGWGDLPGMLRRSALVNALVSPIIATGIVLSQVFGQIGLIDLIGTALTSVSSNPIVVTLLMVIVFVAAGTIMDITPNIIILGPLFAPIAADVGIDSFHFAVFFMTALAVGFITPPIGLNLYVMSGITDEPITDIARDAVPFMLAMLVVVFILAWVPELYLWTI